MVKTQKQQKLNAITVSKVPTAGHTTKSLKSQALMIVPLRHSPCKHRACCRRRQPHAAHKSELPSRSSSTLLPTSAANQHATHTHLFITALLTHSSCNNIKQLFSVLREPLSDHQTSHFGWINVSVCVCVCVYVICMYYSELTHDSSWQLIFVGLDLTWIWKNKSTWTRHYHPIIYKHLCKFLYTASTKMCHF